MPVDNLSGLSARRGRLQPSRGGIVQLQLKSGFRRVWRGASTLQIGLSQRRGTVLGGLTPEDVQFLDRLREGVDADEVQTRGPRATGVRHRELVALLAEADVLVRNGTEPPIRERLGAAGERLAPDAAIWSMVHPQIGDGWGLLAGRAARRVIISGAGRLGSTLAATLAAAGVGQVAVADQRRIRAGDLAPGGAGHHDLGRPREEGALEAVRRLGGQARRIGSGPGRWVETKPDLVVLVEHGAADAAAAGQLLSADIAHLSVVIREDDVVVGPLVRPGSGPCLGCLDLHRGDRDPAWPSILAQLRGPSPGHTQPEETALSGLAAGLAGLQALAHLDGVSEPASIGATLEVELPDGLIARRSWPAHPRCGCHWPPRSSDGPASGPFRVGGPSALNSSGADHRARRARADADSQRE
jgi:bacteriocin biosynthesis cyclodehydratase domain-containing protein